MATEMTECEVWIVVAETGEYECGPDADTAAERWAEIGGGEGQQGIRRVKVTLKVPLPAPIEIAAEVPCEEGEPAVTVG